MIYLDYNATTPLLPEAKDAIVQALDIFGNPSSLHSYGLQSRELIEKARKNIADLIHCSPEEIVFTSGGTESNNIAIIGSTSLFRSGHIITSSIEHPAVLKPLERLKEWGFQNTYIPVSRTGVINVDALSKAIKSETVLITVMHANNETGTLQPIREIAEIAREHNIPFHTDAAQTIGKIEVDVNKHGIDMLSIAGHKFYGPKGIGALYIRRGIKVNPVLYGASQERGISPGTENIIGIAGIGAAAAVASADIPARKRHVQELRDLLREGLMEKIKGITIHGDTETSLPNTLNIAIMDVNAHDLISLLKDKVAFSAGAACHAGHHEPSHVLTAMGLKFNEAVSSVRLSIGKFTTRDEILEAVSILSSAVRKLRGY